MISLTPILTLTTLPRLAGLLCLCTALTHVGLAQAGPQEDANTRLVLEFQRVVLNGKNADAAPKYVSEGYIQHNPRVPNGLDALQRFVRGLASISPVPNATVKRVVAQGDLVVLHSHVQRNAEDRGTAQVDIFRVQDGKLVEHWDVMQPVPETAANTNSMF